ncbi:hypothetical protein FFLO_06681 [Filobasidium floriforme]|uniref:U1 small nuclear ribonucleoprotein C n=1 Tax=Filobasidium floriforme TaxID=5210 RepID=A0A8K0NMM5_9TREE|nr:U1 zinc finger-domain-containing protein [Filobasidium floriforme]KAG7527694.1 hypothetical protein FFLO_06681 [Filobasidium floriforme]KAH8086982.1 U1 zinc finger-domain-containing protein [Filobasidium floriforme]
MGKYYCDYCDVFLTHDSQSVRKAHNSGRNHVQNVIDYYNGLGHNQAQSLIDRITRQYEGGGGPPMGMGMGMGMGGPPVMRSANPPFMGGGPQGFRPPQGYPPFQNGPPGSQPFFPPPGGQNFPPPPGMNGFAPRPPFGGPGIGATSAPTPSMQSPASAPLGVPSPMGQSQAPPAGAQFTSAPPGAANGRAPMINPERMRMMGM